MTGRYLSSRDTIVALSSAPGRAAVAVIRMSGPGVEGILRRVLEKSRCVSFPRRIFVDRLMGSNGVQFDRVLSVFFPAPASYTGQDMAEIHCHGGQCVVEETLRLLLNAGARAALPGEFTRRAFENGKLDLTQAQAVMHLVDAQSAEQVRAAARALEGGLGSEIRALIGECRETLAQIEAEIDFPEDQIPHQAQERIERLIARCNKVAKGLRTRTESEFEIVICGRQNVGKSSILNALTGKDLALVTDIAGTTRDPVRGRLRLCGQAVDLVDTAGLSENEPTELLDRLSQKASRKKISEAALMLWVFEAKEPQRPPDWCREPILVANKADLFDGCEKTVEEFSKLGGRVLLVSAKTGKGLEELREEIERRLACLLGPPDGIPASVREKELFERIEKALCAALENCREDKLELSAVDVREALALFGEILGENVGDDVLDIIFSKFCIGK